MQGGISVNIIFSLFFVFFLFFRAPSLDVQDDGYLLQAKGFLEEFLDVPYEVLFKQLRFVREELEPRGLYAGLRAVKYLQRAAQERIAALPVEVLQDLVERVGLHLHPGAFVEVQCGLYEPVHPLLFLRRDGDDGKVPGPVVLEDYFFTVFVKGIGLFFNGVPLVDRDYHAPAGLEDFIGDLLVVLGESQGGVDHVDHHVGLFYGLDGPGH